MAYTVGQIADALGVRAVGDLSIEIDSLAEPASAGPDQLALATSRSYLADLPKGQARAALLPEGEDWQALGLTAAILSGRARYAMAELTAMMDLGQGWADGVHSTSVIDPSAELGPGVSVGPFSVIGAGARIGAGTVIGPQCHVGQQTRIGTMGFLREGVRIGARVRIGDRMICQPGAVIGSDGFSFVTAEMSSAERARAELSDEVSAMSQNWARVHSLGSVVIGDDVEIGANTTIDRGTIRDTSVGRGTKIDNLVMVGHNVEIGVNCLLCGHVGIAGSARIGDHVVLGGKVGVSDNVMVGDHVVAGGSTTILSNVPAGRMVLGYPAAKVETTLEIYRGLRRLGRLFRDVAELKKTVSNRHQSD